MTTRILNALFVALLLGACNSSAASEPAATSTAAATTPTSTPTSTNDPVQRGRYLVHAGLCIDCHTPFAMGPNGPAPDMTRLLSGHPSDVVMPDPPALPPGPWMVLIGATNTAFAGPWGTSYSANLTPDPETGIGSWTAQNFIEAIRNGRHMGKGRPILPPMPATLVANYTDEDLAAMFAYLQTLTPVRNAVPEPRLAQ